ncbi:archaetidylserine decarboxylase [Bdellovibrio sp. HCB337]|uniref:archaetidylserine decarboxylase n=1 Tax=Bdellovibrio sp. HCB337 TaxID=3394358 RepID=UPI0039A55918
MSAITKFLPRNHLSYFVGKLVHWRGPRIWADLSIRIFAKIFNIDLNEAEKPVSEYPSIGEFFVRKLKPGIRPIAQTAAVHPTDSQISQNGRIRGGQLIQAKGREYHVQDLLANPEAAKTYNNGYFITYYLCPTDYHRVHSPVSGLITKVTHVPGELWPVNKWSVENVHDLFSVNERIIVEIASDYGPVAVVFVGATNVGQIVLSFDESFRGNQLTLSKTRVVEYKTPIPVERGQELGMFRMGSTIVMVYPEPFANAFEGKLKIDRFVKVGQPLTP